MEKFTSRELKIFYDGISDKMDGYNSTSQEKLEEISQHVQKTNGRVKKLEIWQAGIIGAFSVIGIMSAIMGFVLKEQIEFFLHPETKIKEAVESTMANVKLEIELNGD